MNISQLRTFVSVVEHGSFSGAARAMHLSQPAVTMQLQALETDVGATLLDRKYRKIELTEAGRALMPYAERILEDVEGARDQIAGLSGTVTGRLMLAASTSPGQYVLPRHLGSFLADNPEVTVALQVGDTASVVESVEAGEANLGMTGAEMKGAKATFEELGQDDLILVCPPKHKLSHTKDVQISDIVEVPMIMREEGSGTRMVTEEVMRNAGVEPGDLHIVTELGTSEAIVSAVEGGMGIAVVSRLAAEKALRVGTVAEVDLDHFPVIRPLYAVVPRGTLTRAADAFLDHLRQAMSAG